MAQIMLRTYSSFLKTTLLSSKKSHSLVKPNILRGTRYFQQGSNSEFWDIEGSVAVTANQTVKQKNNPSVVPNLDAYKIVSSEADLVRVTKFGHIRLDSENIVKDSVQGQTSTHAVEPLNYVDEQFFGNQNANNQLEQEKTPIAATEIPTDINEVDSQYFYTNKFNDETEKTSQKTNDTDPKSVTSDLEFEEDTIDEQFFGKTSGTPLNGSKISALEYLQSSQNRIQSFAKDDVDTKDSVKSYAKMIPDFRKLPNNVICTILKKSIVYNKDGIVAINKPYGMVTTDVDQKAKLVLTDFLPTLSQLLGYEKLYTVHRLDRDTTGILLLASNQEMANKLNKLFFSKEIKKVYIAITKGVPNPNEGTIDIPITETTVMNRQRMKLRPVLPYSQTQSDSYNYNRKSSKAVTHYKVIRFKGSSALVKLEPETGVRHQIRVHLSEAIQCPILGDHKYSHSDKYAPQKLPEDLLKSLKILPTKTRTIPMHLHAESIQIPNMGPDGKDLVISAPLPQYFSYTLKKLKITSKRR